MNVVFEGHACVDCTVWIANADDSGIPDDLLAQWRNGIEATNLDALGSVVLACDEDCEGHFSTRPCDYCGDVLHGDRHPIVVLA